MLVGTTASPPIAPHSRSAQLQTWQTTAQSGDRRVPFYTHLCDLREAGQIVRLQDFPVPLHVREVACGSVRQCSARFLLLRSLALCRIMDSQAGVAMNDD